MNTYLPWKIVQIDLSQTIPDLSVAPDIQGYYLVYWWREIPLGNQQICASQLPMPASQLADLALQKITPTVLDQLMTLTGQKNLDFCDLQHLENPLKTIENYWLKQQIATDTVSVSVIVCTRDRPEQLKQCLESLQHLNPAPTEIIIVDNAPTTKATQEMVSHYPQIHYVLEPKPGLSQARNAGIENSTGTLIAFTDDDVTVHPRWIAQLRSAFRDPQVMAMTGLVIPQQLETEAQILFELVLGCLQGEYQSQIFDAQFFQSHQSRGVPVWTIGAGANMAFRRQVFAQVGNFDPRLGAGASGCSEDSELWYRILATGGICHYEPTAVVFHTHRRELSALKQQMYQYMRGHIVALLIQFSQYQHWGNLWRLCIALPKHYIGLALGGIIKGLQPKHQTWAVEVLGCLAGVKYYLFCRKGAGELIPRHQEKVY